jgi:hypothetical protein
MSNYCPDENWSVERLGKFCSQSQKRLAVDAWRLGHALNLAFAKQAHGDWQTWKKEYVPFLSHSSEHRYRQLAKQLTEESLEGVGLTDAYRMLDLTYTKGRGKDKGDLFPGAPVAVTAEDEPDGDTPDDSDDLDALPPAAPFGDLPAASGLKDEDAAPEPPGTPACVTEVDAEAVNPPPRKALMEEKPRQERYRLSLTHGRQQMQDLRSWADWLMGIDEGSRFELWHDHRVRGIEEEIDQTIQRLRWLKENLVS